MKGYTNVLEVKGVNKTSYHPLLWDKGKKITLPACSTPEEAETRAKQAKQALNSKETDLETLKSQGKITVNGETNTVSGWCRRLKVSRPTLYHHARINHRTPKEQIEVYLRMNPLPEVKKVVELPAVAALLEQFLEGESAHTREKGFKLLQTLQAQARTP